MYTPIFLFRFINRNRNTGQKEHALRISGSISLQFLAVFAVVVKCPTTNTLSWWLDVVASQVVGGGLVMIRQLGKGGVIKLGTAHTHPKHYPKYQSHKILNWAVSPKLISPVITHKVAERESALNH